MASQALTPQAEILPPAGVPAPASAPSLTEIGRDPRGAAQRFWAQPAVRKSAPMIGVLGLLASAALAWTMIATPPQKMLFSGLTDADKAAASEALTQAGIDSRIDNGSGTLTVAEDDYYKARMLLAAQNLPKAAPGGYAILDQLPMGVSRAVEGERLRQARETELARSIQEIEGVTEARVHLAMPENTVFVRDNAAPSASVVVRLVAGRSLSDAQVRSVVNLVASSVPGMKPDAVTIVDGAGTLLTKPVGQGGTGASDERIDFQRRVEAKYREQLVQLLTPLVGAGNFSAEVSAEVDLSETQATREAYGKEGALRNEQGQWTGNQAALPGAEGIPGTLSNTPPPAAEVRAGQAANQAITGKQTGPGAKVPDALKQSEQYARAFELDKEVSVTRATPGGVKRMSVAVVLREPEGGKPRAAQEMAQLTDLVRAAVGFDAARNDQVTVISRKFAGAAAAGEGAPWYEAGWFPVVVRNVTALVIALLVLFVGLKPLLRLLGKRKDDAEAAEAEPEAVPRPGIGRRAGSELDQIESAQSYDDKVKLVRDFTRDNPARAALAVRDMIKA